MSFSAKETENLINLLSFANKTITNKDTNSIDSYALQFNKNQTKVVCKILLEEDYSKDKTIKAIKTHQDSFIDENRRERQWNNLALTVEENKNKLRTYQNLKDLQGSSVQFDYSNSLNDLIFYFEENTFNKENSDKLASIFKYLLEYSEELKKKTLIKFIIGYKDSFNSLLAEIDSLRQNDSIKIFKDNIAVYFHEVKESESRSSPKEMMISIINKKEYVNKSFKYDPNCPLEIKETIVNADKGEEHLTKLKKITSLIPKVQYKMSFDFNITFNAEYLVKEQEVKLKSIYNLIVHGKLRSREYNLVLDITKNYPSQEIKLEEMKTFSFIPIGQCFTCKRMIQEDEHQYQCYWCNMAFCVQCVEKVIETKSGRDLYLHKEHNLLYFKSKNKEDLEELDEYKLGKNQFRSVDDSSLRYSHSASCNGCYSGFHEDKNNQRYICISCLPGDQRRGGFVDLCYRCVLKMRNKEEFYSENCRDHIDDKHVLLMVIHQASDYYHY